MTDAAKVLLFAWFALPALATVGLLLVEIVRSVTAAGHCTDEGRPDGCCGSEQGCGR